mgnify:CR=1 FL=1
MNSVVLVGRIVRDPELRYIPGSGTPVASFTIAVERDFLKKDGTRDTDFINCEIMGKSAEYAATWCLKGCLVEFIGSIRVDSYEKDGETRYYTKVSGNKIHMLAKPGKKENIEQNAPSEVPENYGAVDEDDVPF